MRAISSTIFLVIFLCFMQFAEAQDMQFSQFYTNILYLNPAMAGSAHATRGILHQRLQWPSLDARYTTSMLSGDHYFERSGSGIGLILMRDWQGPLHIRTSDVQLQFAQEVNLLPDLTARAGIQGGYVNRLLDFSKLSFPDQYDNSGHKGVQTLEPLDNYRIGYFDLSVGGMLYGDNYWVGFSGHHVNQPRNSFYGDNRVLPAKYALVAGYKILLYDRSGASAAMPREFFITPTMHYKSQGRSDQLDAGVYMVYDNLLGGIWYRGIPLLKQYRPGIQNNESFVLLAGFRVASLSFTYSFDMVVSRLTTASTAGAHELNLTYVHRPGPKRPKTLRRMPCPNFK